MSTAAEQAALRSLVRKRVKLERQKADAHARQLIANADAEMDRRFSIEDLGIKAIVEQAQAEVEKINAVMTARYDALGVAKELRSVFTLNRRTYYRHDDKDQRSEKRRKARLEVQAALERRYAELDAWEYEQLAAIAGGAVTSEDGRARLAALPEVTEALPTVEGILGPVESQPLAVIESQRDAKRLAVVRALDADPGRSDRQIGRLLGVDHKTVGRVRAARGEVTSAAGEHPAAGGDFPGSHEGQS